MSSDVEVVEVLVQQTAENMQLDKEGQNQLLTLAKAWEAVQDTMAEVEPDDDYSKDRPRLEKLDIQENNYDDMYNEASQLIKDAMGKYLDLRDLRNRNQN